MNRFFEEVFTEANVDSVKEDSALDNAFNEFNKKYFGGRLYVNKIGWSPRRSKTFLGAYNPNYDHIELNPLLKDFIGTEPFNNVLAHEMIHILYLGHGKDFLDEAERLNNTFGLHITPYCDETSPELLEILEKYRAERNADRAEKINNNVNKPELQETYDKLNKEYFESTLPENLIIKYLPKKTFKTYSLGMVRPDENSDWIWEIKVNRENTEKWMLKGLIYVYCYEVLKINKKNISAKCQEIEADISKKIWNRF